MRWGHCVVLYASLHRNDTIKWLHANKTLALTLMNYHLSWLKLLRNATRLAFSQDLETKHLKCAIGLAEMDNLKGNIIPIKWLFSIIGRPQDIWMPILVKACYQTWMQSSPALFNPFTPKGPPFDKENLLSHSWEWKS